MLKTFLFLVLWGLCSLHSSAQKHQLSLSGTYAPLIVLGDNPKYYQSLGSALGYEYKIGPHGTFGLGVQWNRLLNESKFVSYSSPSNAKFFLYSIERRHFTLQSALRYYFNEAFEKFYVGGFASYHYLKVGTYNFPEIQRFDEEEADPADEFGIGLGLLYGYNYAINSNWNLSLFGSLESTTPDIFFENLGLRKQFGLSIQWLF